MASIRKRKRSDGTYGYTAQIRLFRDGVQVYQESKTFDRLEAAKGWGSAGKRSSPNQVRCAATTCLSSAGSRSTRGKCGALTDRDLSSTNLPERLLVACRSTAASGFDRACPPPVSRPRCRGWPAPAIPECALNADSADHPVRRYPGPYPERPLHREWGRYLEAPLAHCAADRRYPVHRLG